jgi:ankyrin repeat protein
MDADIIKLLLQYSADPNVRVESTFCDWPEFNPNPTIKFKSESADGYTALHALAGSRRVGVGKEQMEECLKLLIDAGGDVNARTEKNKTPLHFAVEENLQLVELSLKYGADPTACSEYGSTLHICWF